MKLSTDSFNRAVRFIRENARPLDQKLFEFLFEDGPKETVLEELAKYQNPDGGFGHGIEPDFRLKLSSPMATSVGLQYCKELEIETNHQIVKSAVEYLISTYESEIGFWPSTSIDVNDEPHAPWWHMEEVKPPEEMNWANPSAEIVGYLHKYAEHVPEDLFMRVRKRVMENLDAIGSIEGLYNILCWQRAYTYLPEPIHSNIKDKIYESFKKLVPLTQETLGEVKIFWLAPTRESILLFVPENVYNLMYQEIERLGEDGGWWPTWKWGQYEDVWPIAEKEWTGKITVKCLTALREFNLIEEE